MKKVVICLMGPTASGKTAASIAIAEHFPCEIISVDSAMVFRGMDIGTAKPDITMREKVPHYLIDICDPKESYSVGKFCKDASLLIKKIHQKNKIPLLVGGTMLYFRALQCGLSRLPTANKKIREALNQELAKLGPSTLYEKLKQCDPETAKRLHPNDTQRIQRALEVFQLSGITLSQHHQIQESYLDNYYVINIALIPEHRDELKKRIAERFHHMLESGFMEEAQKLYTRGDLNNDLPSIRSVGYRQMWDYLDQKIDKETMIKQAIIATQQLAKRQLTWCRTFPKLHTFNSESSTLTSEIMSFLRKYIAQSQTE